jgi:glyoxylase I family protein
MEARIDHVVLWVTDPLRSLTFFEQVVGLSSVRAQEFRDGTAPFPSVRVSEDSIMDLMPRVAAPIVDTMVGAPGSAGHPVNHVCLALTLAQITGLRARLAEHGVNVSATMANSYGARGVAPEAFYFLDPDNNVIEARCYG